MLFAFKMLVSAGVIAFTSWLSGKRPELAGFIVALPLVTLMVLPFSFMEYQDAEKTVKFAQSIFVAVPLSLLFFIPFLFANKLMWNFWVLYGAGLILLSAGYFVHKFVMSHI
jgi:hypothetical protein